MPGLPLIISGDFNTKPDSPTYKSAANLLLDSAKITQTPHTGPLGTFHGFGKCDTMKIDYIYFSRELADCVKNTVAWEDKINDISLSDHYPICTELEV